jgi:hypothetical protein
MSDQEKDKPFVINDRRKFRMDGEPREMQPDPSMESARVITSPEPSEPASSGPVLVNSSHTNSAHTVTPVPEPPAEEPAEVAAEAASDGHPPLPPPPTPEEIEQVRAAYDATSERIDTMMRAQNLGAQHLPHMDFTQLVQSIYMSAMMQLGAGTQQGEQARVDIIGAKNSIDMLNVVALKSAGNLTQTETNLIEAALFELRMGFLEITQLLARQAQAKQQPAPGTPTGAGGFGAAPGFTGGGPRIVR